MYIVVHVNTKLLGKKIRFEGLLNVYLDLLTSSDSDDVNI